MEPQRAVTIRRGRSTTIGGRAGIAVLWALLGVTIVGAGCNASTAPDGPSSPVGPSLASAAQRAMKIRTTVEITGQVVPPPAGCAVYLTTEIRGYATHLGRLEGTGNTCILSQAPDASPPFLPPGPAPYGTAQFTNPSWVLTAANGDQLRLETTAATAVLSFADNSLRARGVQRIVGGTGRFEGAAGVLQASAVNADGQGPDDFESHGWIRF